MMANAMSGAMVYSGRFLLPGYSKKAKGRESQWRARLQSLQDAELSYVEVEHRDGSGEKGDVSLLLPVGFRSTASSLTVTASFLPIDLPP